MANPVLPPGYAAADYKIVPVKNQPVTWALAYPENIIYNKTTGGLIPLEKTGWHNGVEGPPLVGDFELEYKAVITSCARHLGDGDFFLGYAIIDADSTNLVAHVWHEDDKVVFLYFDQGCVITSSVGRCWAQDIGIAGDIGDTIVHRITRYQHTIAYQFTWRNTVFSGLIDENFPGPVWPAAAFFTKGGKILSSTVVTGNVVIKKSKLSQQDLSIILLSAIFLIGTIAYIRLLVRSRKKIRTQRSLIREQEMALHAKEAVEAERSRIAAEMHDDLGASLTSIQYLSDKALHQAKNSTESEEIRRISGHSHHLVQTMSEIIWAMNSRYDDAESLISYIRRHISGICEEHGIRLTFHAPEGLEKITITGERRRALFLVMKELFHNTVRHSGVSEVKMDVTVSASLTITILEPGNPGFDLTQYRGTGNGTYNIKKRMESMKGTIVYQNSPEGLRITIVTPIDPVRSFPGEYISH